MRGTGLRILKDMEKSDKIFLMFMAFTILLAVAGWAILRYALTDYQFPAYWYIPAYFTLFYFVSFGLFIKPSVDAKKFTNKFMGFIVAKLLTSLLLLLVLLFAYRSDAINICVTFLLYYFVLMVPELLYNLFLRKQILGNTNK